MINLIRTIPTTYLSRFLAFSPILIAVLALCLRLYGINWDNGYLFHPDERAILFHVNDMSWPSDGAWATLLNPVESPLNPHWFPYGSLPMYMALIAKTVISPITHIDFHDMSILGRILSSLADVGTVTVVYFLGRRLYSKSVGLLASLLTALSVLHIQLSHFYAVDTFLSLFVLTSVYFMSRIMDRGRRKDYILAGIFLGLALASKISILPIFFTFFIAHALSSNITKSSTMLDSRPMLPNNRIFNVNLLLGFTVSIFVFFIATPYAFLDWSRPNPCDIPIPFLKFLENNYFACDIGAQYNMARGSSGLPFTQQYIGTMPYIYQMKQMVLFGLGLPLGIISCVAIFFSCSLAIRQRGRADILMLAWVLPFFLLTGYLEVKFLRYMLPLTPFLIILGSRMLFYIRDWTIEKRPQHTNLTNWSIGLLVLATGFYAVSYTNVYRETHTAVSASKWINENVPKGSTILREHWEEEIPNLVGYKMGCGNEWDSKSCMRMYESDIYFKLDGKNKMSYIAEQLAQGDYLVLFSNRLYGSIPRVEDKYPQSGNYYRKLFSGKLGYELVHTETSYPNLLGITFIDDTFKRPNLPSPIQPKPADGNMFEINLGYADESFSVYDHPKVMIFANRQHLTYADLTETLNKPILPSAHEEKTLLLNSSDLDEYQQTGTWSSIFYNQNISSPFAVIIWLIWVQTIALMALPISMFLFRSLPDRGYLLAKPLGILMCAYITWILASLRWMQFSVSTILISTVFISLVSLFLIYSGHVNLAMFFKKRVHMIILGESIFVLSFLFFLFIRAANPDLWHPFNGGEKSMDLAYLTAIVRSPYMPPYDPWFSGGYINYYYFGQFIVAILIKATGIVPELAYNLAVPLFFALTNITTFSIIYNLTKGFPEDTSNSKRIPYPVIAGISGIFFVSMMGNLDGIVQILQAFGRLLVNGQDFGQFDFWRSSRAIPMGNPPGFEITEFPFFTFLFGDLHAHMISIPFTLLSLALIIGWVLRLREGPNIATRLVYLLALSVTIGSLRAINTWDFPTYIFIASIACFIGEYSRSNRINIPMLMRLCTQIGLLSWLTTLLFEPYITNYQAFSNGLTVSNWQTPLYAYLGIHALFIMVSLTFLAVQVSRHRENILALIIGDNTKEPLNKKLSDILTDHRKAFRISLFSGISISAIIALIASGYSTTAFLSIVLILTLVTLIQQIKDSRESINDVFALGILALCVSIGVLVEIVTIKGDINRMNTVFKFYFQAWILFGIVTAYFLYRLEYGRAAFRSLQGFAFGRFAKRIWGVLISALIICGSIYTVAGTHSRLQNRFNILPLTLNGAEFMQHASYRLDDLGIELDELRWDYDAIQWIRSNINGTPVIAEGQGRLYRTLHGRVSIYTGMPTILGWDNHQSQQRGYGETINSRIEDIRLIYSAKKWKDVDQIIHKYNVKYIYVGDIERYFYPEEGLEKFTTAVGTDLSLAYSNPRVNIYHVLDKSTSFEPL